MAQTGDLAQIATLLSRLVSPENSHVTGHVVFVDGGAVRRGDSAW
ncbi:hypothetical protein AB4Z09_19570 [Rhodococcus sp. TAF43]|nr:hypothetical protein [Rhodococcus sp. W8901]